MTRSDRVIGWIEEHCRVPEGKDVGKPVVLREWQKAELRKIYDNPHGTRQAILSFPRKNGKTALIAFLLLVHLCGPEAKPNSQLYSSALSKEQAATVYNLAAKMVRQSPVLAEYVICRDTVKELACPEIGTKYAALSADKSTAHGKSPVFAVHDELGQVKGADFGTI
jgi:phage terminase large subunit-like protein